MLGEDHAVKTMVTLLEISDSTLEGCTVSLSRLFSETHIQRNMNITLLNHNSTVGVNSLSLANRVFCSNVLCQEGSLAIVITLS